MNFSQLNFTNMSFSDENGICLFQDLNFDFPLNETVLIRGEAGSGKSLLLKLMAGLLLPTSGAYYINGVNVSEQCFNEFLPYRLAIGYSFENGGLVGNKSLRENLRLPLEYHQIMGDQAADERVDELIESFGLERVQNRRPHDLSGSYKRLSLIHI